MANRQIVIGDIHGCADALNALLTAIAPDRNDTIITLGDYVDRGPKSSEVVEILTHLVSKCKFVPLLGNHELMLLGAAQDRRNRDFWLSCGGDATLRSYGGQIRNVPQHHRIFFSNLRRFYEDENSIFVHACYEPHLELEEQNDETLFWTHIQNPVPRRHMSQKRAFVGHTPQVDGNITQLEHLVLMDTYCFGGQWLSAMDCKTGETWQANELGETKVS